MGRVEILAFPKKSHRKSVLIPKHSPILAEFFGIMLGDGGINNPWQANITVNSVADKEYAQHVSSLSLRLFGIAPALRKRRTSQALVISISSTTVVDFLVENGLVRGNKLAGGLSIPKWIMKNPRYKIACMRGLMDTDGCLYVHKHRVGKKTYRNIGLCFSSYAPTLMRQAVRIFIECGIVPHVSGGGRALYVYSEEAVQAYLDTFGTRNPRIERVYREWKGARVV